MAGLPTYGITPDHGNGSCAGISPNFPLILLKEPNNVTIIPYVTPVYNKNWINSSDRIGTVDLTRNQSYLRDTPAFSLMVFSFRYAHILTSDPVNSLTCFAIAAVNNTDSQSYRNLPRDRHSPYSRILIIYAQMIELLPAGRW